MSKHTKMPRIRLTPTSTKGYSHEYKSDPEYPVSSLYPADRYPAADRRDAAMTLRSRSAYTYILLLILLLAMVGTVSADTTLYYAIGTNSDGQLRVDGYDTFSNARASAGNGVSLTGTTVQVGTWSYSVSDLYGTPTISRYGICFNTSDIPDDATVESVTLGVSGSGYGFTLGNTRIGVTSFNPANTANLVATDYGTKGSTEYANITNTSWTNGGYNNFTLTDTTVINKTANTSLMLRTGWDISGSGPTWSSSNNTYYQFYETSQSGTDKDPFLEVVWTAAGGGADTTPPASITNLANSTTTCEQIIYSWDNPGGDQNITYIQKDGVLYTNATNSTTSVVWSGLTGGQTYQFKGQTVDVAGNMNATIVAMNATATECSHAPTAGFTANATQGQPPLSIQFTDTSDVTDATGFSWTFGDGNISTDQNPIYTYEGTGYFNVSLNVTNASGFDVETKNYYIFSGLAHPIAFNIKLSPGYLNRTIEPWATAEQGVSGIYATAATGLTQTYTTSTMANSYYAKMMAARYVIAGDTDYANKTVDALLVADKLGTISTSTCGGGTSAGGVGDYAIAYDLIWQTKNVNSTLTTANDTLIRDAIAVAADRCYAYQSTGTFDFTSTMASQYPEIAIVGEILSDYVNGSMATTPAQWAALGTTGSWVNDPLRDYTTHTDNGLMSEGFNFISGANHEATSYIIYYDFRLYEYWNVWSNIHGRSFLDEYPSAKNVSMLGAWQNLPMNVMNDLNTDGNVYRTTPKLLYGLLDATNRSILRRQMDLITSANSTVTKYYLYNPEIKPFQLYTTYYNYSSESTQEPAYTSVFNKDGFYNVFRTDWSNYSTWLGFVAWKDQVSTNRAILHHDQLSFEYASHGDLLMPDMGEVKYTGSVNYGDPAIYHNTLLVSNSTLANKTLSVPYRGLLKGGYEYNPGVSLDWRNFPASSTNRINSQNVEYMDATIDNINLIESTEADQNYGLIINSGKINVSRSIMFPLKDYIIVIDRAKSAAQYNFINSFRFGSENLAGNTSVVDTGTMAGAGYVKGELTIGTTPYDWNNQTFAIEDNTTINTNSIVWNTTSLYGDPIRFQLFSAPSSMVMAEKYYSRIGTYNELTYLGDHDAVTVPQIYFKPALSTTLYRATALLPTYANKTPRTPTELTVTGTGSAIKVINGTTSTDYIYTGTGTSNFSIFQTNADTVFIRSNATATYALIVNGSSLVYNGTTLITNASVQPYIEYSGGAILSGDEPAVTPVASFTKDPATGVQPVEIQFTDTSTNTPTGWNWSFGDGTWDNETQSPAKTYATGGNYSVFLIVSNEAGSDTSDIQYVRIYNQTTAILSQNPDVHDVYVPPGAIVVDYLGYLSKNVTRWSWWLDNQWYNGTDHSYYNITHDFDFLTHNYVIGLFTSDDGYGGDWENTTYNITEGVSAQFSGTPRTGSAPVSVQFTDSTGDGADTWFWIFGDGNTTNNSAQNPLHTYATGGLFNVSLNASHSGSFDWENKTGYVNLTSDVAPTAAFTKSRPLVMIPQLMWINDSSLNMTTGNWNVSWGDGSWSNTSTASERNATHQYKRPALMTITLNISNSAGYSEASTRIWATAVRW